jgi:glycosyltransferase involved in cell wall biosynthesis
MRVLHIDTGREMRGGQWQVLRLIEGLAEAGHECVLLAPRSSPLYEKAAGRGLAALPLGVTRRLASESASADLVHAHDGRSHALAAVGAGAPLVVSRRVAFPIRTSFASRWKYARADHYIAVSEHVKGMLEEAGVPAEKISVVHDGVPSGEPARGGRLVVAPATEDSAKGTALVREAARIAGMEVRFSENLEEDLGEAQMFVYITHQEGLGSAALMAMAAGVPVLASRTGGLREIIEDGETGLLTENDPEAIAAAMKRLAADGGLRRRLGERGRERVGERFSVAAMVRGTLDVYTRVLSC